MTSIQAGIIHYNWGMALDPQDWMKARQETPEKTEIALKVLAEVQQGEEVFKAIRRYPLSGDAGYISKHILVSTYNQLVKAGELEEDPALLARIRMKPMRTLSGVTTVTVLTGPHACPGQCIFCPTDARMPKSYLPDEPGGARAFQNNFDPFEQVRSRIESYKAVGHPTDKIELLILGGTWSVYSHAYQEAFVKGCLDAMNGKVSDTLEEAQLLNENTAHRNVGMVIETRPDQITPQEIAWLRKLGVTKVQMGAQSLDDEILKRNMRGHDTVELLKAVTLLRAGGFKLVLHWMPNLLGATPDSDRADFARLWQDYCPDELKIYPTQLMETAELYRYWQRCEYHPYSTEELISLIADLKPSVPKYCRINRIIRDFSSEHVVAGNKRTSLRMDVLAEVKRRGQHCNCIRCREIRGQDVEADSLVLDDLVYRASEAEEHFLQFRTLDDRLAGYLRLSLPETDSYEVLGLEDLQGAAIIREVHIYGQSLPVGGGQEGAAQHAGLGTRLIVTAEEIARANGYARLAVISAIGTRRYYNARGFIEGSLYLYKPLTDKD